MSNPTSNPFFKPEVKLYFVGMKNAFSKIFLNNKSEDRAEIQVLKVTKSPLNLKNATIGKT